MGRSGGGGPADRAVDLASRVRTDGRRAAGPRLVLDDVSVRSASEEWPQNTILAAPVLHEEPVDVPVHADAGHRPTKQRIAELGEIARRNSRAAEEARRVLSDLYQRLEAEVAVRALMQRDNAVLNREVVTLRDEDGRRLAQLKSRLIRDARTVVAHELEEATTELDRLRGVLGDHDAILDEFRDRVRAEQEAAVELRAELAQAQKAVGVRVEVLSGGEDAIAHLSGEVEARDTAIAQLVETIEALTARIDGLKAAAADSSFAQRESETARMEAELAAQTALERVGELETGLAGATRRAREAEREVGRVRREASDAGQARRAAEDALRAAELERDQLYSRVAGVESEVEQTRADAQTLRTENAEFLRELASLQASTPPAEPEPLPEPLPEPIPEPVALPEPVAVIEPVAVVEPVPEPPAADALDPDPVSEPAPARCPSKRTTVAPEVSRREAMAELTSLAATTSRDNFTSRSR